MPTPTWKDTVAVDIPSWDDTVPDVPHGTFNARQFAGLPPSQFGPSQPVPEGYVDPNDPRAPTFPEFLFSPAVQVPRLEHPPDESIGARAVRSALNVGGELATGLSTPAFFAAPEASIAASLPDLVTSQAERIKEAEKTPPYSPERMEAGLSTLAQLLLAEKGGREALKPKGVPAFEDTLPVEESYQGPPLAQDVRPQPETLQPQDLPAQSQETRTPSSAPLQADLESSTAPPTSEARQSSPSEPTSPNVAAQEIPSLGETLPAQGKSDVPGFEATPSPHSQALEQNQQRLSETKDQLSRWSEQRAQLIKRIGDPGTSNVAAEMLREGLAKIDEEIKAKRNIEGQQTRIVRNLEKKHLEWLEANQTESIINDEPNLSTPQNSDQSSRTSAPLNVETVGGMQPQRAQSITKEYPSSGPHNKPSVPASGRLTEPPQASSVSPKENLPVVPPEDLPYAGEQPRTTGIAQRVHDVRAGQGKIGEIQPGQGLSPEEMVNRGRNLESQGVNADEIAQRFATDKRISPDEFSVLRAKAERLTKATDAAEQALRASPSAANKIRYEAAFKTETDWLQNVVQPAKTATSDIMRGMQGETDLDTGTFSGLRRMVVEQRGGRDIKPEEAPKLDHMAKMVRDAQAREAQAVRALGEALNRLEERGKPRGPKSSVPRDPAALKEHFANRMKSLLPC